MPKRDGVSVDKDNIYNCSDRFERWASINNLERMSLDFQKTTAYYAFQGIALPRLELVGPGTVNDQQIQYFG